MDIKEISKYVNDLKIKREELKSELQKIDAELREISNLAKNTEAPIKFEARKG